MIVKKMLAPILFCIFILSLCLSLITSCNFKKRKFSTIHGEVFGTYYRFQIDSDKDFSKQIDSTFRVINKASNSYIGQSEVSYFNKEGILKNPSPTFLNMLKESKKYHQISNGYFSPLLLPIIKFWSNGLKNNSRVDSTTIDSLMKLTDINNIAYDNRQIRALRKGIGIDISAMGEGYTLDAIASILDNAEVSNYMVEIGGEMKCKGKNPNNQMWQVGIETPETSVSLYNTPLIKIVGLHNRALSTSGNYRKFHKDKLGNKYAHIINPKTGYSIKSNLLSVSILSKSSTISDALATACMSMGAERAMVFIEQTHYIEGFLIFQEDGTLKTWKSKKFP